MNSVLPKIALTFDSTFLFKNKNQQPKKRSKDSLLARLNWVQMSKIQCFNNFD